MFTDANFMGVEVVRDDSVGLSRLRKVRKVKNTYFLNYNYDLCIFKDSRILFATCKVYNASVTYSRVDCLTVHNKNTESSKTKLQYNKYVIKLCW